MSATKLFRLLPLLCAFLAFGFPTDYALGQPQILGGAKERQPSYGEMENFTILSYSDLDGWDKPLSFA